MTTFNQDSLNASLEHYGVRGMRWGIKKAESGAKTVGSSTKRTVKKAKKLTEDEIAAIERRRKIGYEIGKNVLIGGAALTVSTLLANPGAGAAVSATLTAASKAVEQSKERGEEIVEDIKKQKF